MDGGENNGNPNPMNKWDDLGGGFPIFLVGNIQILGFSNLGKIFQHQRNHPVQMFGNLFLGVVCICYLIPMLRKYLSCIPFPHCREVCQFI